MAYITVDVCLDEIETPDLVRELRRRGHTVDGKLPPELTETPQMWTNSLAQAGEAHKVREAKAKEWQGGGGLTPSRASRRFYDELWGHRRAPKSPDAHLLRLSGLQRERAGGTSNPPILNCPQDGRVTFNPSQNACSLGI